MAARNKEISNDRLEPEAGVLYIVGTPIGNLKDFSPRATSILRKVSLIACEDTRHSSKLLNHIEARASLISFHKHNSKARIPKLIDLLKEDQTIALITDAGLPGISDPGELLVSAVRAEGFNVICIPGPCAATAALVSSGLPSERYCFEGFLPRKSTERKKSIQEISKEKRTIIIYESPHRLIKLLEELNEICGANRKLVVARELTKRYEEHIGPNIKSAIEYFKKKKPVGEFTLVLGGYTEEENKAYSEPDLIDQLKKIIEAGATANEASKQLSQETGLTKRFLYKLLHK